MSKLLFIVVVIAACVAMFYFMDKIGIAHTERNFIVEHQTAIGKSLSKDHGEIVKNQLIISKKLDILLSIATNPPPQLIDMKKE